MPDCGLRPDVYILIYQGGEARRMEKRRERISCSCGPREQGPLGRETACYGKHSGLEDFMRDARVHGVRRGEQQIKHPCVTCLKFLLRPVETDP